LNQFTGKRNGRHFLEYRLEPGNLERLKKGEAILKHVEDMFPDGIPDRFDLYISFSETPIADAREMQEQARGAFIDERPLHERKRPHCPECKSTVEQLAAIRNAGAPTVVFCATCGCVLGVAPPAA
jgi:hypothetical protein